MKLHPPRLIILCLSILAFSFFSGSAIADCASLNFIGVAKVNNLTTAINDYDKITTNYNLNIQQADKAYLANYNQDDLWEKVISSRNNLILATDQTKLALTELNIFNNNYIKLGCLSADISAINKEYQQSIARLDKGLEILSKVPVDWRDRYQSISKCNALNAEAITKNNNGKLWSEKYDEVIAKYEKVRQELLKTPTTQSNYQQLRQELFELQEQALPGVEGYSQIIISIYEITIKRQQAGCFTISDNELNAYHIDHKALLTEIDQKLQQMLNLSLDFPLAVKPDSTTLNPNTDETSINQPTPKAPIVQLRPATTKKTIKLRNLSGNILCVYQPQTKQTACDFMPGSTKTISSEEIIVFGGGYWSTGGTYLDIKTCKIIKAADDQQIVHSGITSNCSAPSP